MPRAENDAATRPPRRGRVEAGDGDRPVLPIRVLPDGSVCSVEGPFGGEGPEGSGWFEPVGILAGCPGAPAAPRRPSPLEAAYEAWYHQVVLPDPSLTTDPGRAITGLDTYLTIGGPRTVTWAGEVFGYGVRLEVSSTYDVRWGDGTATTGTTSQGGPHPHGDLRHQYVRTGQVTITVSQRWTARWSAGGSSGTIADRLVTDASRPLPVDQVQAVITG